MFIGYFGWFFIENSSDFGKVQICPEFILASLIQFQPMERSFVLLSDFYTTLIRRDIELVLWESESYDGGDGVDKWYQNMWRSFQLGLDGTGVRQFTIHYCPTDGLVVGTFSGKFFILNHSEPQNWYWSQIVTCMFTNVCHKYDRRTKISTLSQTLNQLVYWGINMILYIKPLSHTTTWLCVTDRQVTPDYHLLHPIKSILSQSHDHTYLNTEGQSTCYRQTSIAITLLVTNC